VELTEIAFLAGLTEITGSLFVSLLLITFIFMMLAIAFRMPLEFTALFVMPFLIVCTGIDGPLWSVLGVILIYAGVLLGKNLFFRSV
jgi:hypothetical protein